MPTWKRVALLAFAVFLYVCAFPPLSFWPLVFVAMAPALVALRDLGPWRAAKWGWAFGFTVGAAGVTWFWNVFGHAAIPLWAIFGAWFGLFFAGYSLLTRALTPGWALWAGVAWWTGVEFFRGECYPLRCTLLCLGHAFAAESCPFKLSASWFGAYGLGTIAFLGSALTAHMLRKSPARRGNAYVGLAILSAALVAPMAHASLRHSSRTSTSLRIPTVLVQSETPYIDDKVALSRSTYAASVDPRFVFWPEISVLSDVKTDSRVREPIAALARQLRAYVGVGTKLNRPGHPNDFWNAYVLFAPDGSIAGEYHKIQPVPFMKDGAPGREYGLFSTELVRLGVAICYDADFAWICRRTVALGAEVLVVPVYAPVDWGRRMRRQYVAASVLRAVENDRYVLRPASSGPTMIIDPTGMILERLDAPDASVLAGTFSPRRGLTIYTRYGWLLPYGCQVVSLLFLAWAALLARRSVRPKLGTGTPFDGRRRADSPPPC